MEERDLRALIEQVREGQLPRRSFIQRMVGLGLTAPMASMMLMHEGVAQTAPAFKYKPTKRGGGGTIKLIYWQAAVHLNPHYAGGTKDQDASRIFYEPLASWDSDGNLVPVLAESIPKKFSTGEKEEAPGKARTLTKAQLDAMAKKREADTKAEIESLAKNGGISSDGKVVVWKLKKGVKWHDGKDFTADDVVFTAQYAADPAAAMSTISTYRDIKVTKLDSHTVRVEFSKPTPFWAEPLVGSVGLILPKHVFEPYMGAKSRDNPANLKAVGTGPYKVVDFKPGDMLRAAANMDYHVPNQPAFDALEVKGGGDATSAARAVLQTAEYDVGWNLAVEDVILKQLEGAGKGKMNFHVGSDIEFVLLNPTDPWNEVDGERGSVKSKHPAFTDKAVRTAMSLLIDRKGISEVIYGRGAITTANFLNNPPRFRSNNTKYEFNPEKAIQILEAAGWKKGADGIRAKGGTKLKFVYQTSVSGPRQKCQSIIKDACTKAGIDLELKSIVASVFFGSDFANPDTYQKFWSDIQMFTTTMTQPDPQTFMEQFCSWELSQKANKWASRNLSRWSSKEYDDAHKAAQVQLDPVKRAALFIKMNDLVVNDGYIIPLFARPRPVGTVNKFAGQISAWDNLTAFMNSWYKEA